MYPGIFGGVESQLATDGTNVYAAVVNLSTTYTGPATSKFDPTKGTGEMVAIDKATGKILWDHKFATPAYGAATVTNDVVFTTTFDGTAWALSTKTGKVLWSGSSRRAPTRPSRWPETR